MTSVSKTLSKAEKKALHAALDTIKANEIHPDWDMDSFVPIHGVGTSKLGGFKLGSMRGADAVYRVAIFRTAGKKLVPPKLVAAAWAAVPTGQEILT